MEVHRLLRGKAENILQVPAARAQSFRLSRRLISAQMLTGSCTCWGVAEVLLVLGIPASVEGAESACSRKGHHHSPFHDMKYFPTCRERNSR